MKMSWVLFALVVSSNAMAASLPSILPDGWYKFECEDITVEKFDPPAPGEPERSTPKGTDASGITRLVTHRSGRSDFKTDGITTTIREVYDFKGSDFAGKGEEETKKNVKPLEGNQFEEEATITSKTTMENDPSGPLNETDKMKRTVAVQGGFEVNVKVKNGDEPEVPGIGETFVTKNEDGSYTVVSYRRENSHQPEQRLPSGIVRPGKFVYQYTSACRYEPKGPNYSGG